MFICKEIYSRSMVLFIGILMFPCYVGSTALSGTSHGHQRKLTETNALSSLYISTFGSEWIANLNWLEGDPCGTISGDNGWYGVTCVDSTFDGVYDTITGLTLGTNRLVGTIPSEIGYLTSLTTLNFQSNSLSGSLPSEIGQSSFIVSNFRIESNSLTSSIPSELGQLGLITSNLYLYSNSFTGSLPSQIGLLSKLQQLFHIYENQFTGSLPSQIGLLNTMSSYLQLQSNQFNGTLPSEIGLLTSLTAGLYLHENVFTGSLPSQIGLLSKYNTDLQLHSNYFSVSLPSQLGELSNMNSLRLDENLFQYSIPSQIGSLSRLSILQIQSNQFSNHLPSEFGNFVLKLNQNFRIHNNHFSGPIPSQLGKLTKLVDEFALHSNDFSGSLPSQIGRLSKLTSIFTIQSNLLTGSLPSQIGQLSKLTNSFNLKSNSFQGFLPSELGQLTKLALVFYLNSNQFSGSVPSQLSQMTNLLDGNVSASDNDFCGTISEGIPMVLIPSLYRGNSIGTPCCETLPASFTCTPTPSPTFTPSIEPSLLPTPPPTIACKSGSYFNTETSSCQSCDVGKYSKFTHPYALNCTSCPAGKYNTALNLTRCIQCATGKLSSEDRTYCKDCEAGEYSYNDEECVECEYGKYAPQALTDSCLTCGAGSHTNLRLKATTCTSCDAGKYTNGSSYNCSSCPAGYYSGSGATGCASCSKGFFSSEVAATSCTACSAGSYTQLEASSTCQVCEVGTSQGSTGQASCDVCEEGKYSSSVESTSCSACSAGYYAANTSSSNCSACPVGTYQGSTGQDNCNDCETGKYSNVMASASCTSCGIGKSSYAKSKICDLADEDYYLTNKTVDSVKICPSHAFCLGDIYSPLPYEGYWIDHSSYDYAGIVYKCSRSTCKGIQNYQNVSNCWTMSSYFSDPDCHANSDLQCRHGAQGPFCGSCMQGYVYRAATVSCEICDRASLFAYVVLICFLILLLISAIFVYLDDDHYLKKQCKEMASFIDGGSLKVLWVTYQIIVSSSFTLNMKFPPPFSDMLGFMSIFSFDFLAVECFKSNGHVYINTVYLWCLLPILAALLIITVGAMRIFSYHSFSCLKDSVIRGDEIRRNNNKNSGNLNMKNDRHSVIVNQHTWLMLLLSYVVLPAVSNKQLQVFDCISLKSGKSYLRADTSISCNSFEYHNFKSFVILFLVIYQLIPITWLFLLYRKREALNPPTLKKDKYLTLFIRDNDPQLASVRFLFVDYIASKWWFEILDMYRRILFIGILPLVSQQSATRSSFGCFLAIMSVVYFSENKPYRVEFTNVLAFVAQISILITFYGALSIETNSLVNFGLRGYKLGIFLLLVNMIIFIQTFWFAFRTYRVHRKQLDLLEQKANTCEWAVGFSQEKFMTTFESIWLRSIPSSNALVFHYTSSHDANQARKSGLLALKRFHGIPLTLRSPHNAIDSDFDVFFNQSSNSKLRLKFPNEEVLALSLPQQFLEPLPGYEEDDGLCMISADVLNAFRPSTFLGVFDKQPWLKHHSLLPPHCIIRSFLIADSKSHKSLNVAVDSANKEKEEEEDNVLIAAVVDEPLEGVVDVTPVRSVSDFIQEMGIIRFKAKQSKLIPLYHYTSLTVAGLILKSGLRMSSQGQGDGGVYFSTQGPASYGLGTDQYEVNIIKDCFGAERIDEYKGKGNLDVIIVYGCAGAVLEQTPGGRLNAKMFSKSSFGQFSLSHHDGNYFLRSDRILGAFVINQEKKPIVSQNSMKQLENERLLDRNAVTKLNDYEIRMKANELRMDTALNVYHPPITSAPALNVEVDRRASRGVIDRLQEGAMRVRKSKKDAQNPIHTPVKRVSMLSNFTMTNPFISDQNNASSLSTSKSPRLSKNQNFLISNPLNQSSVRHGTNAIAELELGSDV